MTNWIRKLNITAVVVLLAVGLFEEVRGDRDLRVSIKQGVLVGAQKTNRLTKEPYYAFLGIPFAKPPLGEKRFKDPEDPLPWNGVFNATQEGNDCMTYNVLLKYTEGDEDCLNLNIYTPKKPQELQESLKPVMVWIHGGAFVSGSAKPSVYGPDFLVRHDIILVSINYRLNVFGFLSVESDLVSGNAGLKDQVKALKWIKENIAAFGGDPNCVTIFGESAGGASVHYLLLSPSARGLFHRAISQSGVALNPWASTRDLKETAFKLGEVFDCNTQNSYELVDCLQQVKAKDLVTYQFNILSMKSSEFLTKYINLPCVEQKNTKNAFLSDVPVKMMEVGNFSEVPFMLGVVKSETLMLEMCRLILPSEQINHENKTETLFSEELPTSVKNLILDQINTKPELLLPRNLEFESSTVEKRAGAKMKQFYFQNQMIFNETIDNLINATSDSWFTFGIHKTAELHSKFSKSPVYLYHFVLQTEFAESEKPIKLTRPGPAHTDELKYLFYLWDKNIDISEEEMDKISQINSLWINFAKYGNPTPDKNSVEVVWEPFKPDKRSYFEIGDNFTMKIDLEKERMKFWDKLITEENIKYQ